MPPNTRCRAVCDTRISMVRSIPTTDGQIEELTKALKFFVECAGCSDVSVNHTEIPDERH